MSIMHAQHVISAQVYLVLLKLGERKFKIMYVKVV